MREISNLAHQIQGTVLGIAGLLALAAAAHRVPTGRARLAWPALVLAAGILLLGYLLVPHHGLGHAMEQWAFIFGTRSSDSTSSWRCSRPPEARPSFGIARRARRV